jgi:hypothetical protein
LGYAASSYKNISLGDLTDMNLEQTYATIAEAERVITQDGYMRSPGAARWVKPGAPSLRVIRTTENKFQISAK